MRQALLIAGLLGALALSCTDPNPTFVFDAATDLPREASAADARPDATGSGGAVSTGAGGAGGAAGGGGAR